MPALPTITRPLDLEEALGMEGEKEYRRLRRVLRRAYGSFFLFPIESDFSNSLRDALLERLRDDLIPVGENLRVLALNRQQWDLFALPEMTSPITVSEVVVLIGLEETPGIVPEAGAKPTRAPALALLNQQRETLHAHIPAPFLVWCPPFVYTALMEQAPDFFDHFSGLFRFFNAAPETLSAMPDERRMPASSAQPSSEAERRVGSNTGLAFYERRVAQYTERSLERARALLGLANALMDLHEANSTDRLKYAIDVTEEALTLLSTDQSPAEWAMAQNILGVIYGRLPIGDRKVNLRRAIACFEAALSIYTLTSFPVDWAMVQSNLGNACAQLPDGDRAANLKRAISCFEAALQVRSPANFPIDWARTQNNLGAAYAQLPVGDRADNLQRAIACYEAALRVRTLRDSPIEWAATQNNLGTAYAQLPDGDREENLKRAISCFEAALRVRIQTDFPVEWAMTQNNLGNVYSDLLTGNRSENLQRAVTYYLAALKVRTQNELPIEWAETQFNLSLVLDELGKREQALEAMHNAAIGYRSVGMEQEAQRAEMWIKEWTTARLSRKSRFT